MFRYEITINMTYRTTIVVNRWSCDEFKSEIYVLLVEFIQQSCNFLVRYKTPILVAQLPVCVCIVHETSAY